jgi:hypothetical protein
VEVTVPQIATQNKIRSNKLISPLHTLQRNPEHYVNPQFYSLSQPNPRPYPNRQNLSTHTLQGRCFCVSSIKTTKSANKSPVISTEAAHSPTVSSDVEKSASPPTPLPGHDCAVALAVAFAVAVILT